VDRATATLLTVTIVGVALVIFVLSRSKRDPRAARLGLKRFRPHLDGFSGEHAGMHVHAWQGTSRRHRGELGIQVSFSPCRLVCELRPKSQSDEIEASVVTGDSEFDETWSVEGAPEELVQAVLGDAHRRARLREFAQHRDVTVSILDGEVTLNREYDDDRERKPLNDRDVRLAIDLARSAADVSASASERIEEPRARASAARKVLAIRARMAARTLRDARIYSIFLSVIATGFTILLLSPLVGGASRAMSSRSAAVLIFPVALLVSHVMATIGLLPRLRLARKATPGVATDPVILVSEVTRWAVFLGMVAYIALH
jgi:hypothetical protein